MKKRQKEKATLKIIYFKYTQRLGRGKGVLKKC